MPPPLPPSNPAPRRRSAAEWAAKTRGRHHAVPPPGRRSAAPEAAEGRRARGVHQAAADDAPLSNAGAFFSKNVRW
jgi:hypothetical protein